MSGAVSPWTIYGRALSARRLRVHAPDGAELDVPLGRWLGHADAAEEALLRRARGPVLDVGCGPGRHVLALQRRGVEVLGVDASPDAVTLARSRGASVCQTSVFDPIDGPFRSVLLLDGNLGIGGDPLALLQRVRALLVPGGAVLAEVGTPTARSRRLALRLRLAHELSAPFPWAIVSAADVDALARASGFAVVDRWRAGRRWFVELRRC
jgi:SAM-dependent methyltransferase